MSGPADPSPPGTPDTRRPAEPVSRAVMDTVLDPASVVERVEVEPTPTVRRVAGGRHESRERAVHLLYETEMRDRDLEAVLQGQVLAPDEHTDRLVRGVTEHRDELDERIGRLARGWSLERMATLDLVILRVACFELGHCPEVPTGVVLAEAVDLASGYGATDDSPTFVNGVLAAAAAELR